MVAAALELSQVGPAAPATDRVCGRPESGFANLVVAALAASLAEPETPPEAAGVAPEAGESPIPRPATAKSGKTADATAAGDGGGDGATPRGSTAAQPAVAAEPAALLVGLPTLGPAGQAEQAPFAVTDACSAAGSEEAGCPGAVAAISPERPPGAQRVHAGPAREREPGVLRVADREAPAAPRSARSGQRPRGELRAGEAAVPTRGQLVAARVGLRQCANQAAPTGEADQPRGPLAPRGDAGTQPAPAASAAPGGEASLAGQPAATLRPRGEGAPGALTQDGYQAAAPVHRLVAEPPHSPGGADNPALDQSSPAPKVAVGPERPGMTAHGKPAAAGESLAPIEARSDERPRAPAVEGNGDTPPRPLGAGPVAGRTSGFPDAAAAAAPTAEPPDHESGAAREAEPGRAREPELDEGLRLGASSLRTFDEEGEFAATLEPAAVGRVGVRVVLRDGTVRVSLAAERPESAQLMQAQAPELKSALEGQGVRLSGIEVDTNPLLGGPSGEGKRYREHERQSDPARSQPRIEGVAGRAAEPGPGRAGEGMHAVDVLV